MSYLDTEDMWRMAGSRLSRIYDKMNRLCREYGKASGIKEKKNSDEN